MMLNIFSKICLYSKSTHQSSCAQAASGVLIRVALMLHADPQRGAFVHELEQCNYPIQPRAISASVSTRFVHDADRVAGSLRVTGDERLAESVAEAFRVATSLTLLQKQLITPAAVSSASRTTLAFGCSSDRALLALLVGTLAVLSPHRFADGEHAASGLLAALVAAHAHLLQFLRHYVHTELLRAAGGNPNTSAGLSVFDACIRFLNDRCFDEFDQQGSSISSESSRLVQ